MWKYYKRNTAHFIYASYILDSKTTILSETINLLYWYFGDFSVTVKKILEELQNYAKTLNWKNWKAGSSFPGETFWKIGKHCDLFRYIVLNTRVAFPNFLLSVLVFRSIFVYLLKICFCIKGFVINTSLIANFLWCHLLRFFQLSFILSSIFWRISSTSGSTIDDSLICSQFNMKKNEHVNSNFFIGHDDKLCLVIQLQILIEWSFCGSIASLHFAIALCSC